MCVVQPFGGFKQSGLGREGGVEGISRVLETKVIQGLDERELSIVIKVMALLTRKPGLTLEQFDTHWHKPHGIPLTLNIEGIRHSVQNARLADADDLADAPFDGIPEVWLDDLAAAAGMQQAPGYAEADADQQHFMDIPKLQFLLTDEEPVDGECGPGDTDGVNVIRCCGTPTG